LTKDHFLFKGCLIPTRLPYLETASKFTLERIGVDFDDLPGATCCVEPIGLRSMAQDTWLLTTARMLSMAERDGRDIITLCNGCYLSFVEAMVELRSDHRREEVNTVLAEIGHEYHGKVKVRHVLEVLHDLGPERTGALCTRDMSSLKVAPHTGCHALRPSHVGLVERPFAPHMLADISSWLGAEVVHLEEWPGCCGGGIASVDEKVSAGILDRVTSTYRKSGANCIVTPCPFCFSQFDLRQKDGVPVLHLVELSAYAMGAPASVLGWKYHRIRPTLPF
jgi:heterodisulfide reductase subunit B